MRTSASSRSSRFGLRGRLAIGAVALAIGGIAMAGCGSSSSSNNAGNSGTNPYGGAAPTATGNAGGGTQTLTVKKSSGGVSYLVDSSGKTVYMFQADSNGKSNCTGAYAAAWPPLTGTGKLGSGVSGTLTTFTRSDGTKQIVLNGHPLYEYTLDTAPGQTNGEGVNAFGGLWYVLGPTGNVVTSVGG
ncbi:MAG TPA: hypothetical protein VH442_13250 [Micromonosporaceae bacterium]